MRYFLIVLFFAANLTAFSQSEPELASKALKAFQSRNYEEAVRDYMKLVSIQPRSTDYNYHYGVCLLKTAAIKKDAIKHLEFAAASDNVPVEAFFYLGKACHLDYQFKKAITYYQIFKTKKGSQGKNSEFDVDRELEMCQNGMKLLKDISDLVVEEKRDYSASEFYRLYDEKSLNGSILISNMDQTKTDKRNNHVPVIFYPNQPDLIFFSSYGEKDTGQKNIYFKRRTASGWSAPQPVSGEVNTEYDEDFPYYDANRKILYFSSKGHNSMGGYDIFSAQYDPNTESFKNVRNLDFAISSTDDDLFYVPGADNTAAWFASARESKPGKMTIYKVAVERYPATIAFIKGIFESTAFKDNKRITLELTNKRTNRKIGTYHTDDKGVYSIPLYFSGDYEYQLSIYGVNKVFPLKFTIPKLANLTQYGQKIIHKRVDGVDYVELLFLPESEIRPDDEQLLEFIREMSTLDVSDGNTTQQDASSKTFYSLQSSIQKGTELLEGKLEMETKANQKIYNNIQTISLLQYELKNLVAKEDASSLTAQQLKEAKQKLARIDALEQENKLLKALTDSLSLANESVKIRLEIVKNLDRKLQILSGADEASLGSFKQENEGSFRLLETITAEKENDSFEKYETLKKQLTANVDAKRDLEAKLKEIQAELISLNNKLNEVKGKEKASIEEQIASKKQQSEQITGEIQYLDKKIDALQKERKTIEERKDLLMSVSQVSSTRQLSNEEITEELNKLESKNFKSIRNLLEEAYDRLLDPGKVEQLTLNDIQNGKLEQAWSQYQNIKGTDITSEQQEVIANYEKELQAEAERISSKSTKTTEEQRYLNKLKTELVQVQHLKESFTEATQSNEPSGESYTTKQFVSELYPQLRSDLNQKLSGESEVAVEEAFDKLLSKIEQQEKVQQKIIAANPKSKELQEEQNQLSQLKSELLKAKSDWKLAGLKAQTEQQTDNISKDRWIDEIDPEYNQELDRINEQEYENDWDKVIALKNKEEALLVKIKNKQNGVKSSGLDELLQEVESSVNQLKQRLQYVIDKEAEKSLNTSVSVQKAIKQLDFKLEKSVFEEQAADLQKVIEKEIADLKELKTKVLPEKVTVNVVDKAIESLEETLLLLESKQSEYEQLNSIAATTSENNSSTASSSESQITTSEENVTNPDNSNGTTAAHQSEETSSAVSNVTSSTNNSENNSSAASSTESQTTTSEENITNPDNPNGIPTNLAQETSSAVSKTVTSANSQEQLTINLNNENAVKSKQLLNAVQNDEVAKNISEDEKVITQIQQLNVRNTKLPEEYTTPEQLPVVNTLLNELEKQINTTGFEDVSTRQYVTEALEYMKSLNTSNSNLVKKITEKEVAFVQNELALQQQKSQLSENTEKSIFSSDQLNQRLMLLENQLQQANNDKKLLEELQLLSGKKEREEQQRTVQLLNEKAAYLKKEIVATEEQLQEDKLSEQRLQELLEEYEELEAILVKMKKANAEQVVLYQLLQKEFKNLQQLRENEQQLKKQLQVTVSEKEEDKINNLVVALAQNRTLRKQLEALIASNLQLLKKEINNPTPTYQSSSENTAVIQKKVAEMAFTLQPQQAVTADQIKTILESENYPKGLFYRIQVGAFAKPINENVYKDFSPVTMENLNKGLIKYMAGYFTEENVAATARDQIRKLGFTDAFIVAYCDGKRIPVFEARRLLREGLCLPVSTRELLFHIDPTKQELITQLNSPSPAGTAVTDKLPVKIEQKTALQMKSGYTVDVQSIEGLYFTVQIGVFNRYVEEEYLKGLKPVNTDEVAPKVIRFSVGIFDDLNKAKEQRLEAIQKGFADAFIVAYYKGKRITVQEANLLLQQNKAELVRLSEITEQGQSSGEKQSSVQEVNYIQVLKEEIQHSTVVKNQEMLVLPEGEGQSGMEIHLASEELELPFYWWVIEHFESYFLQRTADGIMIHVFCDEDEREAMISELESLGFENVQIKK